jgi:hypothetical protein
MAKKRRRVKRVLGLRVPKPMGRFLASPAGQLAIAGVIVGGAVAAARSSRVRAAVAMAGRELKEAGVSAGYAIGSAAKAAMAPVVGAAQQVSGDEAPKKKRKRKGDSSPRLEQEDYEIPH